MSTFNYKAKKGVSEIIEGSIESTDKKDALEKLMAQGIFPIEIEEETHNKKIKKRHLKKFSDRPIRQKDVLLFVQNLATLTRAKIELLPSLNILYNQIDNKALKAVILKIYNMVKEGQSFSSSLEKFPKIFSPLFVSMVKAGETSGSIDASLSQLTGFIKVNESLKNKVLSALVYPAILLSLGIMSVLVILTFVIPKLKGMLLDLNVKLPLMTKIILKLSDIVTVYGLWVLIGVCIVLFIISRKGIGMFSSLFRYIILRLPVISRLIKNQELSNFSSAFSLLIKRGVAPLNSLEVASLSVTNVKMKEELKEVAKKIRDGQNISDSMQGFKNLPSIFIKMIEIGEQSGRLEEVLDEVSVSCSEQVELDAGIITSIIEPILILVIGMILGVMVFSILLPIFQITQMIQ